mgnify:CR=1 FL=1
MLPSVDFKFYVFLDNAYHSVAGDTVHYYFLKHCEHPHGVKMYHKVADLDIHVGVTQIRDPIAQRIVESIEYDYSKFDTAKMSEIGCAIRCRFFDDMVTEFVRNHKNPVIVNLGCGLLSESRFIKIHDDAFGYEQDIAEGMFALNPIHPDGIKKHRQYGSNFQMGHQRRKNPRIMESASFSDRTDFSGTLLPLTSDNTYACIVIIQESRLIGRKRTCLYS